MSPAAIGVITFGCAFGGVLAGVKLRRVLPAHHVSTESKDTVRIGIGLVSTMTALVLGLVTASAKSSFDAMDQAIKESAESLLSFDRTLARYGPETAGIREALKRAVTHRVEMAYVRCPSPAPSSSSSSWTARSKA